MYFGEAATTLDDKGRVTMASQFRKTADVLSHAVWFMTRGFDGSLFLFPKERWDQIRSEAGRYSTMDSRAVDFRRLFFGSVSEVRPDGQGRIAVEKHLQEYSGLSQSAKDAVLVGCDDHLELWSRDGWKKYQKSMESKYKEMGRELFQTVGSGESVAGK